MGISGRPGPVTARRCPVCHQMFYDEEKYVAHLVNVEGWTREAGLQNFYTYDPDKKIVYLPKSVKL